MSDGQIRVNVDINKGAVGFEKLAGLQDGQAVVFVIKTYLYYWRMNLVWSTLFEAIY